MRITATEATSHCSSRSSLPRPAPPTSPFPQIKTNLPASSPYIYFGHFTGFGPGGRAVLYYFVHNVGTSTDATFGRAPGVPRGAVLVLGGEGGEEGERQGRGERRRLFIRLDCM